MEFTETFPVIVKPRRPIIGFTSMAILKKRVEEICAKILTVDIKTKKLETQVSISRNIYR